MTSEERRRMIVARLTARAWREPEFHDALIATPGPIMESAGLQVPAGIEVAAVENTATTQYIVIPQRPDWLSDSDLSNLSIIVAVMCGFDLIPTTRPRGRGHTGHRSESSQLTGVVAGSRGAGAKKSAPKKGSAKKSAAKKLGGRKSRGR
jgi:hypothetical protein